MIAIFIALLASLLSTDLLKISINTPDSFVTNLSINTTTPGSIFLVRYHHGGIIGAKRNDMLELDCYAAERCVRNISITGNAVLLYSNEINYTTELVPVEEPVGLMVIICLLTFFTTACIYNFIESKYSL